MLKTNKSRADRRSLFYKIGSSSGRPACGNVRDQNVSVLVPVPALSEWLSALGMNVIRATLRTCRSPGPNPASQGMEPGTCISFPFFFFNFFFFD